MYVCNNAEAKIIACASHNTPAGVPEHPNSRSLVCVYVMRAHVYKDACVCFVLFVGVCVRVCVCMYDPITHKIQIQRHA